jgi:hypothetical protein
MAEGPTARLFGRVADQLDYLVTLAQLRILDAVWVPSRRRQPIGGVNVGG